MDLEAITISNFRSIRGSVTVPLDAPVVLIHGLNGAGKTSVLAAIELALTGQFAGAVPPQPGVLVHRGSKRAIIQLDTTDGTTSGKLAAKGLDLSPMLGEGEARFYAERCYLTQARLGRLLEIYQSAEGRTDTPLTRFIKDLLRLERLDALVDGLHAVGDKRNLPSSSLATARSSESWARVSVASRSCKPHCRHSRPNVRSSLSHCERTQGILESPMLPTRSVQPNGRAFSQTTARSRRS